MNPEHGVFSVSLDFELYWGVRKKRSIEHYKENLQPFRSQKAGAFRLIDAYLNISGHNTYDLKDPVQTKPFNFPASRFLRPYSNEVAFLGEIRLRRIKWSMDNATIHKKIFRLWWLPHHCGINTDRNIKFLAEIVKHYNILKKTHGMVSTNMDELCPVVITNTD